MFGMDVFLWIQCQQASALLQISSECGRNQSNVPLAIWKLARAGCVVPHSLKTKGKWQPATPVALISVAR